MKQCCDDPITKCFYYKCDFPDCSLCLVGKPTVSPTTPSLEEGGGRVGNLGSPALKDWLGRNIGYYLVRNV